MQREEIAKEIWRILHVMDGYEWNSAKVELTKLYERITETPADIQWDEERINIIGRNGNTGEHYEENDSYILDGIKHGS
jgi:hypothetical protein